LWIEGRLQAAALAAAALFSTLVLQGCASLNTISEGGDSQLMLHGHDPVAYFTAGAATPGRGDIKTTHRGLTYRFASEENKRQFITSPDRYAPQFGGFSALDMTNAVPAATDGRHFKIIDGKLYLFDGPRERVYFEMDQERNLRLAHQYWDAEVRDAGSWPVHAFYRSLIRVKGYRSEADLAAEYERRFGRKPQ
jgi:YHS domain-containing protein